MKIVKLGKIENYTKLKIEKKKHRKTDQKCKIEKLVKKLKIEKPVKIKKLVKIEKPKKPSKSNNRKIGES